MVGATVGLILGAFGVPAFAGGGVPGALGAVGAGAVAFGGGAFGAGAMGGVVALCGTLAVAVIGAEAVALGAVAVLAVAGGCS